jgi:hypothetical protein
VTSSGWSHGCALAGWQRAGPDRGPDEKERAGPGPGLCGSVRSSCGGEEGGKRRGICRRSHAVREQRDYGQPAPPKITPPLPPLPHSQPPTLPILIRIPVHSLAGLGVCVWVGGDMSLPLLNPPLGRAGRFRAGRPPKTEGVEIRLRRAPRPAFRGPSGSITKAWFCPDPLKN